MSEDAIFPNNQRAQLEADRRLVWVPWQCSCCRKRIIGFVRLVPCERRPLTRGESQIVGTAICLN